MVNALKMFFINNFVTYCDAPEPWQIGPQDPATPIMEGMIFFHNYLMFFMILVGVLVFYMILKIIFSYREKINPTPLKFTHSSTLEIIWTILPAVVLLFIAIPSFTLLYSLDEFVDPVITIKIIGHQWYWTYEYSDYVAVSGGHQLTYDSYVEILIPQKRERLRLLETDNRIVFPKKTHIRILVTSSDVIHSWAVPSFGIKIDGTPGRLTQGSLYIKRSGVYYGQCSEICGVNHAFMPIAVNVVSMRKWTRWMALELNQLINANSSRSA